MSDVDCSRCFSGDALSQGLGGAPWERGRWHSSGALQKGTVWVDVGIVQGQAWLVGMGRGTAAALSPEGLLLDRSLGW